MGNKLWLFQVTYHLDWLQCCRLLERIPSSLSPPTPPQAYYLLDFTSFLAYDMLHNDITDDVNVCHNINVALMNHSNPASSSSTPPLHYSSILTNTETTNSSSSRHIILDRFAQFCLEREVLHEQMIKRHELIRNTTNLE